MTQGVTKIKITAAEAGQKILSFLQRNIKNQSTGTPLPQTLLHRLVRSGQVRVNSGRVKPFHRLEEGDEIRIPPLGGVSLPERSAVSKPCDELISGDPALGLTSLGLTSENCAESTEQSSFTTTSFAGAELNLKACLEEKYPDLEVIAESQDYIVFCKPAGLAVHPGTRQSDSLITRLQTCVKQGESFAPTLAHRLDKNTSGVLLVAKSYKFLRAVQDALAGSGAVKEYVAWVKGAWAHSETVTLEDFLEKRQSPDFSRMERVEPVFAPSFVRSAGPGPNGNMQEQAGSLCLCKVRPLASNKMGTLMHIELLTGRTHQIRVQLASRGFPIIGDRKYDGPACKQGMLLHSFRFSLPVFEGVVFEAAPKWSGIFEVEKNLLPKRDAIT